MMYIHSMQALTFGGVEIINHQAVADPKILQTTDAIVEITLSGICGSDLHVYHGREEGLDNGTVMGHEFVGSIIETGSAVKNFVCSHPFPNSPHGSSVALAKPHSPNLFFAQLAAFI